MTDRNIYDFIIVLSDYFNKLLPELSAAAESSSMRNAKVSSVSENEGVMTVFLKKKFSLSCECWI